MSRIDEILDYAEHLPSLPAAVAEAIRVLSDESTRNDDVAAILMRDQALVAQLLKLANSAYYGVSRRVSTVKQALLVLGRNVCRGLVIAAGSHDLLARPHKGYLLERGALWQHSLAVGQASSMIAARVNFKPADEAFVAGLLHDIGKVVLSAYLAERSEELLARLHESGEHAFTTIETELLQIDHATLGGVLADHWQLPASLGHAIRYHHHPSAAGDDWQLAAIVHTGNLLALTIGVGLGVDGLQTVIDEEAITRLGIDAGDLDEMAERLADDLRNSNMEDAFG